MHLGLLLLYGLLVSSLSFEGGWRVGPRYLVVVLPSLVIGWAHALSQLRTSLAGMGLLLALASYAVTVNALAAGGGLGVSGSQLSSTDYPLTSYGTDTNLQASLAATALATDATFSCNGLNVSSRIKAQGSPTWMYEFRDQTAIPIIGMIDGKYPLSLEQGAAHAAEG